jgi:type II secretory pathway component PulF
MTYPLIIFLFLIGAVIIVLVHVMPQVKGMFVEQGIDLPAATLALIATSDFMVNHYMVLIFILFTILMVL